MKTATPTGNPSAHQLHTLRHMLGINTPYASQPRPYRNYAAVVPGDRDFLELEALGLVYRASVADEWAAGYDLYRCTQEGIDLAIASHGHIRVSKAKRVYARFLDLRDAIPDLSFRIFLTEETFQEIRKGA
jgi:hypothetical protein